MFLAARLKDAAGPVLLGAHWSTFISFRLISSTIAGCPHPFPVLQAPKSLSSLQMPQPSPGPDFLPHQPQLPCLMTPSSLPAPSQRHTGLLPASLPLLRSFPGPGALSISPLTSFTTFLAQKSPASQQLPHCPTPHWPLLPPQEPLPSHVPVTL